MEQIRSRGQLHVRYDKQQKLTVFLPEEIEVSEVVETADGRRYHLINRRPKFTINYTIYAVTEGITAGGQHATAIAQAPLVLRRTGEKYSRFKTFFFPTAALIAFLSTLAAYRRSSKPLTPWRIATVRWLWSIGTVSLLYSGYHYLYLVPEAVLPKIDPNFFRSYGALRWSETALRTVLNWLYFDSSDYEGFARWIADPLYLYMLTANLFVLRFAIRPEPGTDKHWQLMERSFALLRLIPHDRGDRWLAKVGFLTLAVKAFYVPYLTSWAINDLYHQRNLSLRFDWSFAAINEYLVALFILIDVSFFAVGYIVELPQLRNQIRSVEPTLLGWLVCLWCYPPFNNFSFAPFDYPLNDSWVPPLGQVGHAIGTVLITILWGIYTSATVALCWKSSNLTNRGIVARGPYAFVRHPAYASKLTLWGVESFFLGKLNFFYILGVTAIYALRAWTEERHLSRDDEFVDYKRKVRFMFIPGIL